MVDSASIKMPSTLTVAGGPQDGQSVSVEPGATRVLGSGVDCALTIGLGNVAAQHARLTADKTRGLLLSDLSSATGTYVNGEKIGPEHVLSDGDRVCLGPPGSKQTAKLVVRLEGEIVAVEPALILDAPMEEPFSLDAPVIEANPEPAIILDDVPPPVVAPPKAAPAKPAAPPVAPPAAAAPKPLPPPKAPSAAVAKLVTPAPPRKAVKPEYTTDGPSIAAPEREKDGLLPPALPMPLPAAELLKKARKPSPKAMLAAVPRPVLAVVAGLAISGLAYFGWGLTQGVPPVMEGVLPPKAEGGQTVTLQGSGFGSNAGALTVRFGEQTGQIISATDSQVAVTLPQVAPAAGAADFPVTVENRAGRSNAIFLTIAAPPRITAFVPDVAMPGDTVTIEGKNLEGKQLTLLVNGQPAEIVEQKPGALSFRVPSIPVTAGEPVLVVVSAGRESSRSTPLYMGRLPLVIETRPVKATAGDRVAIRGRGFDTNLANVAVTFGNNPALVMSATATEIVALVPGSGILTSQMDANVVVQVRGSRSNSAPFILTRPSSGYFVPHYFPTPVADHPGFALISTDIGPVLALGSPADAPTTPERASRVAAALNALVEEARTRPVSLEVRDKPVLGVGVTGRSDLLVAVTGDDLAAYGALDPTLRSRRVTQRSVAAFWAALLQDQLALFVTRDRPFRVVEITTRGRALMQIYSEALRRAGTGGGVPVGVVNPLPSNLGRDLQDMALILPTEGTSTAAAAMEGRWIGTMWEEGQGDKRVAIRLELEGSRLTGSLTTRAGKVGADIPLENVSFDRGQLRFSVAIGGVTRQFQGQVQGGTVTGEIAAQGAGSKGRFTLKYSE